MFATRKTYRLLLPVWQGSESCLGDNHLFLLWSFLHWVCRDSNCLQLLRASFGWHQTNVLWEFLHMWNVTREENVGCSRILRRNRGWHQSCLNRRDEFGQFNLSSTHGFMRTSFLHIIDLILNWARSNKYLKRLWDATNKLFIALLFCLSWLHSAALNISLPTSRRMASFDWRTQARLW